MVLTASELKQRESSICGGCYIPALAVGSLLGGKASTITIPCHNYDASVRNRLRDYVYANNEHVHAEFGFWLVLATPCGDESH